MNAFGVQTLYRGPAVVVQEALRANVRCRVDLESDPDHKEVGWSGYFWGAYPPLPVSKGEATLIVPGARATGIMVTDIWPGSGSFTGRGPPPRPSHPAGV
jgi:hypothetical protein